MEGRTAKSIANLVWQDPERVSGQPCFYGTRVPVEVLFDFLEGGDTVENFLTGYPSVTHEQAIGVLQLSKRGLEQMLDAA